MVSSAAKIIFPSEPQFSPASAQIGNCFVERDDAASPVASLLQVKRIVIAKRDRFYAQALQAICHSVFGRAEVQICRLGEEALECLRKNPADLLLTGMTFPDIDGIDVVESTTKEKLAVRTMVVSHRRDEYSLFALRSGRFDGFFDTGEEAVSEMRPALENVISGRGYISPSLRPFLLGTKMAGVLEQKLTRAEIHVLRLIGDGTGNAEAALRLRISEFTVQKHRRNIMQKLEVPTSAKLVCQAVRLGVVRITDRGHVIRPGARSE